MYRLVKFTLLIALSVSFFWANSVEASDPLTCGELKTITEDIDDADVVMIVELAKKAVQDKEPKKDKDGYPILKKSKFKLINIIKGNRHLEKKENFEWFYFGDEKKGSKFLMMGLKSKELIWTTSPIELREHGVVYLEGLKKLPKKGPKRLLYFLKYLENPDDLLARDSFDELNQASYKSLQELKKNLKPEQLITWIKDKDIPTSRRRLYFKLLGVCGTKTHCPMLEELIKSKDRKRKRGLDAILFAYVMLKGPEGLNFIDKQILTNEEASYIDIYCTKEVILNLNHESPKLIPKERLLKSLRLFLDNPEFADLAIITLAKWKDWSVVKKLVKMFKDSSDPNVSFVRIPIIRYLKACPKQEAKEALVALEKLDPDSFKQERAYFGTEKEFENEMKKKAKKDPKNKAKTGQK